MAEICPNCGLPKDICQCGVISKEQQRIKVFVESRKWRKAMTIIQGFDEKSVDLGRLAQRLKTMCACGGTAKNGEIQLQGDQRDRVEGCLVKLGFQEENIDVQ